MLTGVGPRSTVVREEIFGPVLSAYTFTSEDEALKLKKEQFNLRFQRASGQLQDTARVRVVRRDIARVKTIVAQKRAAAKAKD